MKYSVDPQFPKPTRWQSKKYRDGARDQPCTMRLFCCNDNPDTTVLAHANGGGMGTKVDDYDAADMCSSCHDSFDRRSSAWNAEADERFQEAKLETIINRIQRGILK